MGDGAADDLLDAVGLDAGAAEEFTVGLAQQVGGVQIGERASTLADRGAYGFDDDGFRGHELVLSSRFRWGRPGAHGRN
ncbi:hypothetical protein SMICM304S_11289 [Streptomyces microflavus]